MKAFSVVVATDSQLGIGLDGRLPWSLKGDMRWFKELTTCPDRLSVHGRYRLDRAIRDKHPFTPEQLVAHLGKEHALAMPAPEARNAVIMGRRTWDGLPEKFKPLPGRLNGVLSRQTGMKSDGTFHLWSNLDAALAELERNETVREIFLIGGGKVYAAALNHPACVRIYQTRIEATFGCDTFFPSIPPDFVETAISPPIHEGDTRYHFALLERTGAA
jgi:dihydrofolate reductase